VRLQGDVLDLAGYGRMHRRTDEGLALTDFLSCLYRLGLLDDRLGRRPDVLA